MLRGTAGSGAPPILLAPWLPWKPTPVWEGLAVCCLSPPPNPYVEVGGGPGGMWGRGLPHPSPRASLFAEKPFWSLRGMPLVGRGTRIKRINVWVLGSQLGTSHKFSHFIFPGSCQVHVYSPILQLKKWRPRKMKLLGQGSIVGTRLSLDLDADLFLPCSTISQCSCSQPHTPASPPAPRFACAPEPFETSQFPDPNCSVSTPGPPAGLVHALPSPTFPAASDLRLPSHCHLYN